jgi:L-iditol 2-dehydrogenase
VLGTSGDASRMGIAKRLGADRVVDVQTEDAKAVVGDLTQGYGADVVIECAGAEASAALCLDLVRKMGRYTQVGLFGKPLSLDLDKIVVKQVRLQGSMCHTWATWERTMRLLRQGLVDLRPFISRRLPLGQWEDGFQGVLAKRDLKVLLHPEE